MHIAVLGAGAWGTALAVQAAPRHDVLLWGRDAAQIGAMRQRSRNERYLPEVALPPALRLTHTLADAFAHAFEHAREGLFVVAAPMSALRSLLAQLPAGSAVVWLCKGFEAGTAALGHEVAAQVAPTLRAGVLSGPSFALEVARGQPTALVAASTDAALAARCVEALHAETLRIYTCDDPVGVEVGGAVKNVLAIATGVCDGIELGLNARAALVTRGLAEMTRLGMALGARAETFMGLSGLGDLVLTATGDLSRNRQVGLHLARGERLADILAALGHVAEGVHSASVVLQRVAALGVQMPITQAVVDLLEGRVSAQEAARALMAREARAEAA
jgi:glycerol-3-phosphate dehydrogenase (NAD(P)+)